MDKVKLSIFGIVFTLITALPAFANTPPVATLSVSPSSGSSPLEVVFDASGSYDPDGMMLQFEWDLDGDGNYTINTGMFPYVYAFYAIDGAATVNASVRVTDGFGSTATAGASLSVNGGGNGGYSTPVTVDVPGENTCPDTQTEYVQDNPAACPDNVNFGQDDTSDPYVNDTMGDGNWLQSCYAPIPNRSTGARVYQSTDIAKMSDEVLRLCNIERANNGLQPLKWGFHLEIIAQAHARDMALRGYFDHTNLFGMSLGDRFDAVNPPKWNAYAENIAAGNQTAAEVVDTWMNSPGHRANILNPDVKYLGVGCYYLANDPQYYGFYWVQFFASFFNDPSGHDWLDPDEVG